MATKSTIKSLLEQSAFDEIAALSLADRRVVSQLISLSYDKQSVTAWRAIEAMGYAAQALSTEDPSAARDTIRRLLWMMTDESGGIGWSAPEMLGEIIRTDPDEFSDIIPILWSYHEEEIFRDSTLWGMARVAEVRPDLVGFVKEDIPSLLEDSSPVVRGYAAWLSGCLANTHTIGLEPLLTDESPIPFYRDGHLHTVKVADIAKEAMKG
ncbi:MAG: DVU0298 family protein [Chloroflexota bacterium]